MGRVQCGPGLESPSIPLEKGDFFLESSEPRLQKELFPPDLDRRTPVCSTVVFYSLNLDCEGGFFRGHQIMLAKGDFSCFVSR